MSVGKVNTFDVDKDNWGLYIERLEQYFVANDVKESVKVATLITVIGSEAYELMVNLCTPVKPATKTFSELVSVMKNHLQPQPSILAERFKFRQRKQKADETIAEYVAELKKLSKSCKFGSSLKESLRDQLVCGLLNDMVRQRLFAEDESFLTFDNAFKLAITMEAAEADAAMVESRAGVCNDGKTVAEIHYAGTSNTQRAWQRRSDDRFTTAARGAYQDNGARAPRGAGRGRGSSRFAVRTAGRADGGLTSSRNRQLDCQACGAKHDTDTCKFKRYVCRVCNNCGHLKRVCPRLREETAVATYSHRVEEGVKYEREDSESSEEVNNYCYLNYFKSFTKYPEFKMYLYVNGKHVCMEVDTGSVISCISYQNYLTWFSDCALAKSNLRIHYYTGEIIEPVGKIKVSVCYKDKNKSLDLYIVNNGKTTLLGREWMYELGIQCSLADCNVLKTEKNVFNLNEFSSRFSDVFADGLGRFTGGKVSLRVRPGSRPVFMRARPLAYALREPVERALDSLVKDGIITPVETSDWATPIVPVVKKDGTIRLCGDFKLTLNKCLEVDRFPVPKVDDLLAKLHGGKRFSKIDLSQAYAQLELDDSKQYAVINTHKGLFRYNRLIYGLSSSPGIFQRKLEQMFADMMQVGVFLDDVIITGQDDSQHLSNLYRVFERLQKYGLRIKKEKCTFFADSVTYLGYIISKEGVHTCPEKIKAIKEAPVPNNVSELRSFLGLVMYYAKFVRNISTLLEPLYCLLKKHTAFNWNSECHRAFNEVKALLVSTQVLAHYSADLPLVLTTDASSVGVGAVISHLVTREGQASAQDRPIAYASRVLNSAERGYSQIEREALAIIYGVKKFHQYLYGRKFILRTDHKPLVTIFGDKTGIPVMAASRMQRWAVLLSGYNYDIEYVATDRNGADALSRLPIVEKKSIVREATYLNFVQNFVPITRQAVKDSIAKDEVLRKVVLYLQSGWPGHCSEDTLKPFYLKRNELYLDRGCIMWGYRLVVPIGVREMLLRELHMGHMGIVKMKSVARSYIWWPGIDADIERTCGACATCAMESAAPPRAPPQPWPYVAEPWSRLHIDFLGPFHGRTFLVIIDSGTKWIEAFPMIRTTAVAVIKVLRETFARFGLPREIVSDNGPPFASKEYAEFMANNGIKLTFSPVYHPASNGAAENAVKLCKGAVKKAFRDGVDMDAALQSYLLAYRNVEHSTTGSSPASLLQRRTLRSRLDLLRGEQTLEERVQEAQRKQVWNAGGTPRHFTVGEEVWARDYSTGKKWRSGRIESRLGSRNYLVSREDGPPFKRHVDQIKSKQTAVFGVPWPSAECTAGVSINHEGNSGPIDFSGEEKSKVQTEELSSESSTQIAEANDSTQHTQRCTNVPPPANRPKRIRKPIVRHGFEID